MAKIQSPVKGYTGVVVGVNFTDGEAETDRVAAISYFKRQGYTIDGDAPAKADGSEQAGFDLATANKDELKAHAKALGLAVGGTVTELRERIEGAGNAEQAPADARGHDNTDQVRDAADVNADGVDDSEQAGEITPDTPAQPSVREA